MPTNVPRPDAEPDGADASDTRDADVERLAREFGDVVENLPEAERQELRDYAVELVRDESDSADRTSKIPKRPLGPFGFLVLLVLAGGALLFVVPPVGIVLLLLALPVAGWGVVQTAFGKGQAPPSGPSHE